MNPNIISLDKIKTLGAHYPKPTTKHYSYGTAGFRMKFAAAAPATH
jgi:hypothetical protein